MAGPVLPLKIKRRPDPLATSRGSGASVLHPDRAVPVASSLPVTEIVDVPYDSVLLLARFASHTRWRFLSAVRSTPNVSKLLSKCRALSTLPDRRPTPSQRAPALTAQRPLRQPLPGTSGSTYRTSFSAAPPPVDERPLYSPRSRPREGAARVASGRVPYRDEALIRICPVSDPADDRIRPQARPRVQSVGCPGPTWAGPGARVTQAGAPGVPALTLVSNADR